MQTLEEYHMWVPIVELCANMFGRNACAKTDPCPARERGYCLAQSCHSMGKTSTLHLHAVEE